MRDINETIARIANDEDGVKGRFWEGRFKSQALLDQGAPLTCMTYVELNPIRPDMADDLTSSDFTSIQQRIFDYCEDYQTSTAPDVARRTEPQDSTKQALDLTDLPDASLMPFGGSAHTNIFDAIAFTLEDYFNLAYTTGRVIRMDKRGTIDAKATILITRFDIDPNH